MLLHFAPGAPREAYFEGLAAGKGNLDGVELETTRSTASATSTSSSRSPRRYCGSFPFDARAGFFGAICGQAGRRVDHGRAAAAASSMLVVRSADQRKLASS